MVLFESFTNIIGGNQVWFSHENGHITTNTSYFPNPVPSQTHPKKIIFEVFVRRRRKYSI